MPSRIYSPEDDARAWRRRSAELALACAGSTADEEAMRLRELSILLATAPVGLAMGLVQPDPRELESLARSGAALVIALRLIEQAHGGYILSAGGGHMASVILPGTADEVTSSGDTAALAMIGALALALSGNDDTHPLPSEYPIPDGARLN
jgi:hypothetical protein